MQISAQLLRAEIVQRRDDGCDALALGEIEQQLDGLGDEPSSQAAEDLYNRLDALGPDAELELREPSELDAIRQLRPDGPRALPMDLDDERLTDRMLGAWLGRAAGCALGKPVESWSRAEIRAVLEFAGEYPLERYIPPVDWPVRPWHSNNINCLRGNISRMARDDDMDYTLLGLVLMERCGHAFTTQDVGDAWLRYLPYHSVYTAERETYRNLVAGLGPPETATWRNPFREWIGAQIRADFWGYAAAGLPELAAEFAWRDARLSHVKNGIYGEMWMAASIAAAFVVDDPVEAIRIGLSEIPAECRLARAVTQVLDWHSGRLSREALLDKIEETLGAYHGVHTINNAALVVAGLLLGDRDLGTTICAAVEGGWDTDCNSASAGSLVGAMVGANAMAYEWVGPLNDTLETALSSVGEGAPLRFSDLAARSAAQARIVRKEMSGTR